VFIVNILDRDREAGGKHEDGNKKSRGTHDVEIQIGMIVWNWTCNLSTSKKWYCLIERVSGKTSEYLLMKKSLTRLGQLG
jgi:hypothetical protein